MTTEDNVQYWISLSDEDLSSGVTLLGGGHYLYVGFMCHQALEKIFKAFYTKLKEDTPPYVHKLAYLAQKGDFYEMLSEEQKDFVSTLEPLNIEARYPEYKMETAKMLTHSRCIDLLEQTKTLQQWIKEKLL